MRNRWLYFALTAVTVAVGLLTRRFGAYLPAFVGTYAPDALYALMAFWIAGFVWPRARTAPIGAAALAFTYAVEIGQLFHPAWLEAIRHTRPGGLVLGFGFLWSDIACYTAGVAVGVLAERCFLAPALRADGTHGV